MMEYKGYIAVIGYDDSADLLHGHVVNAASYAIVNFMASDVEGLKREFKISMEDYLSWRGEDGFEPAEPFPGKLELPLYRELRRRALRLTNGLSRRLRRNSLEIDTHLQPTFDK